MIVTILLIFFYPGSVESRILKWFKKASNTIVANISIDATKYLDDFQVSLCIVNSFFIMPYRSKIMLFCEFHYVVGILMIETTPSNIGCGILHNEVLSVTYLYCNVVGTFMLRYPI
jgi:hypothetical protein